jgi:putative FmdB family regulatory protein
MPFYEFRCTDCQTTFDKMLKSPGEKPGACPECGRERVSRLFSAFSIGSPQAAAPRVGRCGNPNPTCGPCIQ